MSAYYITTPIFYVNSSPHLGHAYTAVVADTAARIQRLMGQEVRFLTGTDEHGQKIENSANLKRKSCKEFVDENSELFRMLMHACNISNDDFIRTTEIRHKKAVEHIWKTLEEKGDIYLGKYSGWYCVREETFFHKSELTKDLLSPSGSPVEWIEEDSYFFALSKWQDKLLEFYENNPDFIQPAGRTSEVINFIKSGLKDLSISRTSCSWGIPVPGSSKHTIYVWLDALVNYISALGYPDKSQDFSKFWPANVHVIGKDILRFHAIYWPAFLMSAGLALPKNLLVHGWWTKDGEKMSKSLGNVVDPIGLIQNFGVDAVRYFLLREMPLGKDGNISKDAFIARINSELADKIGNLVQRTLSFVRQHFESKIPDGKADLADEKDAALFDISAKVMEQIKDSVIDMQFQENLGCILELASATNKYLENKAPWAKIRSNRPEAGQALYTAVESIRHIGIYLQPFLPQAANKILNQLCIPKDKRMLEHASTNYAIEQGTQIVEPEILFKKVLSCDVKI